MIDYIVFWGENGDGYGVDFTNIVSLSINDLDYKEFIKKPSKIIHSYKLITYRPIHYRPFRPNSFFRCLPHIYTWCDFTYLDLICDGKKYETKIIWIGDNDYYSYGQSVKRDNDFWIYEGKEVVPKYFETIEFELLVKNKLNKHFDEDLTREDVLKIKDIDIYHNYFNRLTEAHYRDLALLENLEHLEAEQLYHRLNFYKLAKSCEKVKVMELDCLGIKTDKFLKKFKNLECCYISNDDEIEIHNDKLVKKHPEYEIRERKEIMLSQYNDVKETLDGYLAKGYLTIKEYDVYLRKINKVFDKKLGGKKYDK